MDLNIITDIADAIRELIKEIIAKYGFTIPTLILTMLFFIFAFGSAMTENLRIRKALFSFAILIMLLAFIWFLVYAVITIPVVAG